MDHRTLLIQPATLEVWEVPASSLKHDFKNPVFMDFDIFESLGANGCLSAERFLHHDRAPKRSFDASQVAAVKLKTKSGAPPMYAWGSRMVTTVPEDVHERVHTVVCESARLRPGALIGGEFLWLWPLGKAYNAYITRKEQRRLRPEQQPSGIDEIEPTVRYSMATPGLMLGPDDVEGVQRVPLETLSAAQRLFLMCIKPQQTLFPRRPVNEQWTTRAALVTDANQRMARRAWRRGALGALGAFDDDDARAPHISGLFKTNKRPREPEVWDASQVKALRPKASDALCRRLARTVNESGLYEEPVPDDLELRRAEPALDERAAWVKAKVVAAVDKEDRCRYWRWEGLPNELLVRILCVRLGEALTTSHAEAMRTITSLRAANRGMLALVDSFVGIQTADLYDSVQRSLDARAAAEAPGALGMRMRSLGLGIGDVLRLKDHTVALLPVPTWTLPKTPHGVPDWKWYLELRREAAARQGDKTAVRKPRVAGRVDLERILAHARAAEPHVWAARFGQLELGGEEEDARDAALLAAAGEAQLQSEMRGLAGV